MRTVTMIAIVATVMATTSTSTSAQESKWIYESSKDEMRNVVTKKATITSENTIDLDSPYDAADNRAYLTLLRSPDPARMVALSVGKGQFVCGARRSGEIAVKFDDGMVGQTNCEPSRDGRSNIVWIPAEAVDMKIGRASRLVLEANFYGSGRRQMVFQVGGLSW